MSNTIGYSIPKCSTGESFNFSKSAYNDSTGNFVSYAIPQCSALVVSVVVTPNTANLNAGGYQQFYAEVLNLEYQSVNWSCLYGTINSSGLYLAPNDNITDTITATSTASGAHGSASAIVTVPEIQGFNPIIEPTLASETTATYEPNIIYENEKFVMWYTGGWASPSVYRAESIDGTTWSKGVTPVIGNGYGGVIGIACRPTIVKHDGHYYCYYASDIGNNSDWMRVSSTDGITWNTPIKVASYDKIPNRSGFANSSVWVEDGVWFAMCEVFAYTTATWAVYLMQSSDGVSWSVLNDNLPLSSLQVATDGMYGGVNLFGNGMYNGEYHVFYHAAPNAGITPTNIYHAVSTDRINWTRTIAPVLSYDGDGLGYDQIADASVLVSGGKLYIFYDQTDNTAESAYIGVAELDGTFYDFISGGQFVRIPWKLERRPNSSPTEYWNLTETSGDRVGSVYGINLSPYSSVTTTTSMSGGVAAMVSNDGRLSHVTDDRIQVGNFDWSICGWFRVSKQSQSPAVIVKSAIGNKQFDIYAGEPNGLRFVVYKTNSDYEDVYGTPGVPVPSNTWIFFHAWHAAALDSIGLQINNGNKYFKSWAKGANPTGMSDLVLGSFGASNSSTRDLSKFGFWKRLLSDSEVTTLYNSGMGVDYPY